MSSPGKNTPSEDPLPAFRVPKGRSFRFILLSGLISPLAAMTREGIRGISGPAAGA